MQFALWEYVWGKRKTDLVSNVGRGYSPYSKNDWIRIADIAKTLKEKCTKTNPGIYTIDRKLRKNEN